MLRKGTHEERTLEFADVLAWLATIANVAGVDLTEAVHAEVRLGLPRLRPIRLHVSRCGKTMRSDNECKMQHANWQMANVRMFNLQFSICTFILHCLPGLAPLPHWPKQPSRRRSSACAWAWPIATRPGCGPRWK